MPKKKKVVRKIKKVKKRTRFTLNRFLFILLAILLFCLLLVVLNPKKVLVFKGTVPCADCPGIEQTITLNPNNTYLDENIYLERNVTYVDEGKWTIIKKAGKDSIYELNSQNGERKTYYVLEENRLFPLDSELNPLPSPYNAPLLKSN